MHSCGGQEIARASPGRPSVEMPRGPIEQAWSTQELRLWEVGELVGISTPHTP